MRVPRSEPRYLRAAYHPPVLIRRFLPSDLSAACEIQAQAFGTAVEAARTPPEVRLLVELVDAGDAVDQLSFVALVERDLVGHVLASRAAVAHREVVAVGPIGVVPAHQGRGVGTALMHALLGAADALDVPLVVLLGAPAYYGRFGFRPARRLGIEPPDASWADDFQVRTLTAYDATIVGRFAFAPAFDAL